LKTELKARGQPVTGLKSDLKKRLAKVIEHEKVNSHEKTSIYSIIFFVFRPMKRKLKQQQQPKKHL